VCALLERRRRSALDNAYYSWRGGKSEKAAPDNYKGLLHPFGARRKPPDCASLAGRVGGRAKPRRGTDAADVRRRRWLACLRLERNGRVWFALIKKTQGLPPHPFSLYFRHSVTHTTTLYIIIRTPCNFISVFFYFISAGRWCMRVWFVRLFIRFFFICFYTTITQRIIPSIALHVVDTPSYSIIWCFTHLKNFSSFKNAITGRMICIPAERFGYTAIRLLFHTSKMIIFINLDSRTIRSMIVIEF